MARTSFIIGQGLRRAVPPVLPPFPVSQSVQVGAHQVAMLEQGQRNFSNQVFPLSIGFTEKELWQFPVEPLISISGENTVIRRNVAKTGTSSNIRGTVKERWNQDDYRITINGFLYNPEDDTVYPEEDVKRLRDYCEARQSLFVECDLFKLFGIFNIVIESYEIPFTKGENRQEYSITAYSDEKIELFIDTEANV